MFCASGNSFLNHRWNRFVAQEPTKKRQDSVTSKKREDTKSADFFFFDQNWKLRFFVDEAFGFFFLFSEWIGKMIQLQVHLQLPCYDFCFLYWRNVGELSNKDKVLASPITCIAPSSETTTGGVYKWQGRNRHSLMSYAYEIFLVTRPIIAILGPNWVDVIPVFPRPFGQPGPSKQKVFLFSLTL